MVDWLNELREGVVEAYSGIIQGLKGDDTTPNPDVNIMEPHIPFIIQFIILIATDTTKNEENISACSGLVG
jgi:importin subunit beta-1